MKAKLSPLTHSLMLTSLMALCSQGAGVSTNKLFVLNTNNVIPPDETNFFVQNSNLLNQAVNGSGGGGGGGGVSGIATLGGLGTNTYLTNASTSGQTATNLSAQGYGTNSLTVNAPAGPYHPLSTWSGGAQVSYTDSGGGYTIAGLGTFTGNGANITNVPPSALSSGSAAPGQALEWNGTSWVPASINNYVNFALVGGVNDGVTDNTVAFSNALNLVGNVGVLYLPKGAGYKVSGNINITNGNLTILGDGPGTASLGSPSTFASVIIWTNLVTNCFNAIGTNLYFQSISAFWTNTIPPTGGAFCALYTNSDQVNGQVTLNLNQVLIDGGFRCLDYQAGSEWGWYNANLVRWWYDGVRINNLANNDIGGWTILNSGWEAYGGRTTNHVARSFMRWEGSGGGQIVNSGGGAFNWSPYNDTGGYTNAFDIEPEGVAGASTGGLFFFNCIVDNWGQNAFFTHKDSGNTNTFVNIRMMGVQAESYVSGRQDPVSFNSGIGNGSIIDNFSVVTAGMPDNSSPLYFGNMQNISVGYVQVNGQNGTQPLVNPGSGGTQSTGIEVLPDGTGFYDPYLGYPQLREGSFFVQSESANQTTLCENGYYASSGWTYENNGPSYAINYNPNNNGTLDFVLWPTNTAGSSTGVYPVQLTLTGKGQATIPTNLTVGGVLTGNGGTIASNNSGNALTLQATGSQATVLEITNAANNNGVFGHIGTNSGALAIRGRGNNTNTLAVESGTNSARIMSWVDVSPTVTNDVGSIDTNGNLTLNGTNTAAAFAGVGTGLTALVASALTGTLPWGVFAGLTGAGTNGNVLTTSGTGVSFVAPSTGGGNYQNASSVLTNLATFIAQAFNATSGTNASGNPVLFSANTLPNNGGSLTNIPAGQLVGTVPNVSLPTVKLTSVYVSSTTISNSVASGSWVPLAGTPTGTLIAQNNTSNDYESVVSGYARTITAIDLDLVYPSVNAGTNIYVAIMTNAPGSYASACVIAEITNISGFTSGSETASFTTGLSISLPAGIMWYAQATNNSTGNLSGAYFSISIEGH